ncbi:hypothetical protein DTL21_08045 [Bremerella cremea]|uniref:Uncharacterized protein n=1 Tax=Blastopirellula marina TaxID=124 RepID=A0A2S8FUM1_9BACT|nr:MULTISPECIES: O-methyltransferase [Pirellulaceae]PQO35878.1 hypothetical protein C5Y83_08040 [Blastopirellula marina]RCS48555.1 hypothetical protein DTL21_08045 [Bremerella cremea]
MSGHDVPYQLRTNKYVERQLFLDVLDFVRIWNGPSHYVYASMGGRFLEDFKQINHRFAIERMISIELDSTTCDRQKYNRLGFIECLNKHSTEFVNDLDQLVGEYEEHRFIVWLDFALANKRGEQLDDFRNLVSKLSSGDVVKITLNANPQSFRRPTDPLTVKDFDKYLKDPDSPTHSSFESYVRSVLGTAEEEGTEAALSRVLRLSEEEYQAVCLGELKKQLDENWPANGATSEILNPTDFAKFLGESIGRAASRGNASNDLELIPLALFRYRDGDHQMMTATGIIADAALRQTISQDESFAEWPLRSNDWGTVTEITVPDLSAKERHHIDGMISADNTPSVIHGELPFRLDRNDQKSLRLLEKYVIHYRRYPAFGRVYT